MSKRHSAKYKIDRAMGENLWGRSQSPVNKRSYGPGQHGQRRKSKVSDFGLQLKAKQKLKGYYGNLTEKQFRKTYDEANRLAGPTGENLLRLLESRLDNVVYRAGLARTRRHARQLVTHGHFTVNGVKTNIPSFQVSKFDIIDVKAKSLNTTPFIVARETHDSDTVPAWLDVSPTRGRILVHQNPVREQITVPIQEQLIVEYYSKI